jgi:hypothetical protein
MYALFTSLVQASIVPVQTKCVFLRRCFITALKPFNDYRFAYNQFIARQFSFKQMWRTNNAAVKFFMTMNTHKQFSIQTTI